MGACKCDLIAEVAQRSTEEEQAWQSTNAALARPGVRKGARWDQPHLLVIILIQVLGKDIAVQGLPTLIHGWLAPAACMVPKGGSGRDGRIQTRHLVSNPTL